MRQSRARIFLYPAAWRAGNIGDLQGIYQLDRQDDLQNLKAIPGYHVAFSHSGATLGLILGELLAFEVATGGQHPMLAAFRPERFSR